ncbi:F0F1 ATP synthase subunit B [Posidoniimonas polymericola]|uniref:F0F1 ATP synthase subunit B n=1 Tax=Posidoniimonas polymericola TaxID=2528002 RepID=UPI0018D445EE|nr:F0F1 ATP synthase subunit B [Posidoniimonas polymericola]
MPSLRLALLVLACLALTASQGLQAQETEGAEGEAPAAAEATESEAEEEATTEAEDSGEEGDAGHAEDEHDEAAHDGVAHGDAAHDEHAGGHGHELGHGNAHESLMSPSELQADLAIYSLFVFLVLMALLAKFAWPKIAEALDQRERAISDNIAAAQEKHDQAAALLAEHRAKIDAAADEVREMLEEARRDAEATKGQIVSEARDAADAERQRALRDIENAKDGAVKSLAEQSAALAVDLASKVVRQEISHDRQSEIVREALGLMGPGSNAN